MRIVEDFLDDIAGSIEQKAASTIVLDDQEVEELLPNDDSFRFQLYFHCPQLELLRNENSIKKAIDKGIEMISSLFDASRQVENYSAILPVSTHRNHENSKHFQKPVIRDTYSTAGFEAGVNFHLTNIKGVLKLVKILANIADSFTKRYEHGAVTVMKWVDREGKRQRDSKCIRAGEINYFADQVLKNGVFSMSSTDSTVIEFTYLAYFLYDVSMEDLTIYNQICALTNYFMRKTALNVSVKVVEKMWGRHAEVELPESFAKRLENAKADINNAESMAEFDNTYAGFINVPSASKMPTTDTALEDLRDTQKLMNWRDRAESKALTKLISHPREIYGLEFGVVKNGETKEFFVYFAFTLGPVSINFWNIDEIAFIIYNKFDRENKNDIEKAVIKTLNSIWTIFGVKPDEKEKAKIIEKVHYELANTNLFG